MTNKALKAALLKKLGVTKQRLSQRVKALKKQVPMNTEEATYCLAHKEGLPLDKFMDSESIAQIQDLVAKVAPVGSSAVPRSEKKQVVTRLKEVRVGGTVAITDPILPARIVSEAKEMSEKVYLILYIFENSVREVIRRILTDAFGAGWWDRCASDSVKRTVSDRVRQEKDTPWHGARGAHPIFYADIKDLVSIVRNNDAWQKLKPVLGSIEWFSQLINSIGTSRNPVAHMNPISKHDRQRVIVNFRDWEQVVKARRSLIPMS